MILKAKVLRQKKMTKEMTTNAPAKIIIEKSKGNLAHFLHLLSSMFRIGFLGYGGGCALIPVIEQEVVKDEKLVTRKEYNKHTLVACITPGALPVEIAAGMGLSSYGISGMIFAALALAVPGSFLTVLITMLLSNVTDTVLTEIQCFSIGAAAFVSYLLILYAANCMKESKTAGRKNFINTLVIIFGVYLLGVGKIFGPYMPWHTTFFGLSTIQILGLAFFGIFFTECTFKNTRKILVSAVLILIYLFGAGKAQIISNPYILLFDKVLMWVLAIYGIIRSFKGDIEQSGKKINWKPELFAFLKEAAAWLLFIIVFSIPALIISKDAFAFIGKGIFSTLISFGGGDAYLSVADGLFVGNQGVTESEFYTLLVPVANVLPGSILSKILTGIAYYLGYNIGGSAIEGFLFSLSGFAVSVGASGLAFIAIYHLYNAVENISIIQMVGKWIRPIISGLLLTVTTSMIYQNIKTAGSIGLPVVAVLILTAVIIIMSFVLSRRLSNAKLIFISIGVALVVCNILFLI